MAAIVDLSLKNKLGRLSSSTPHKLNMWSIYNYMVFFRVFVVVAAVPEQVDTFKQSTVWKPPTTYNKFSKNIMRPLWNILFLSKKKNKTKTKKRMISNRLASHLDF